MHCAKDKGDGGVDCLTWCEQEAKQILTYSECGLTGPAAGLFEETGALEYGEDQKNKTMATRGLLSRPEPKMIKGKILEKKYLKITIIGAITNMLSSSCSTTVYVPSLSFSLSLFL